jgi:hypothetical protein
MVLRGHAAEALDHETGMTEEEDAHKHQLKQAEQLLRDAGFTSDEDGNYRLEEDPGQVNSNAEDRDLADGAVQTIAVPERMWDELMKGWQCARAEDGSLCRELIANLAQRLLDRGTEQADLKSTLERLATMAPDRAREYVAWADEMVLLAERVAP